MMVPAVRRRFCVRYNSSSLCRLHIQCGGPFHRTRGRQSLPSRSRRRQQQGGRRRRKKKGGGRGVERRRLSRMSQRRSHRFVFASVCVTNVKIGRRIGRRKKKKKRRETQKIRRTVYRFNSSLLPSVSQTLIFFLQRFRSLATLEHGFSVQLYAFQMFFTFRPTRRVESFSRRWILRPQK